MTLRSEDGPSAILSQSELEGLFTTGPRLTSNVVLVIVGGRMYKRESDARFYLLEDRPRSVSRGS